MQDDSCCHSERVNEQAKSEKDAGKSRYHHDLYGNLSFLRIFMVSEERVENSLIKKVIFIKIQALLPSRRPY